jgi:hypothetical protein
VPLSLADVAGTTVPTTSGYTYTTTGDIITLDTTNKATVFGYTAYMNAVSCSVTRTLMHKATAASSAVAYTGTWVSMDTSGNVYVDTTTPGSGIYLVSYVYDGTTYITTDFTVAVTCAPYTTLATFPAVSGVYYKN